MADDIDPATTQAQGQGQGDDDLLIPAETKQKYGALLELIINSESMNNDERQYWINILPIMTPEQVENLKGILVNEREQLAAIDKKYSQEIEQIGHNQAVRQTAAKRRERRAEREEQEAQAEADEDSQAAAVLDLIENS